MLTLRKIINDAEKHLFWLVLILAVTVSIFIRFVYQAKAIVVWDEGFHSEWIYWLSDAARAGSWADFWQISKSSFHYPPLFLWIMVLPTFIEPVSIASIRFVNLLFYILSAITVYLLALSTSTKYKRIIGLLSAGIFIFSPMSITFATIALREMMGVFFTLTTLLIYIYSYKKRPIYLLLTSVSFVVLSLVKYNFGILLFSAYFLSEAFELVIVKRRAKTFARFFIVSVPYAVFLIWWVFIYHDKFGHLLKLLQNETVYTAGLTDITGYLLFYPRAVVLFYSPSVFFGVLALVGFAFGIYFIKNSPMRLMWLYAAVNIILGTIHTENVQERYIFTIFPCIFIVGISVLVEIWIRIYRFFSHKNLRFLPQIILLVFSVIGIYDLVRLPGLVYAVGSYTNKVALYNEIGFKDLWFDYNRSHWRFPLPEEKTEKPYDVFEYIAKTVDLTKPVSFIGETNELSQPYRNILFSEFKRSGISPQLAPREFTVVTTVSPTSKFYTHDYKLQHIWKVQNRFIVDADPTWEKIAEKEFKDLGVKIEIFGRK
ncbi:hypothetical protein A2154_01735 [Candidatus Gottesmanbacteria bacterium RBG_16_43_7]|uniref:ArnT-like N-terminal domain-containing protein n=1 Tax=Candidatus Gottesmanbacteria bacterium RBG_16_43_7 TaxID=1798373 RepID=A0A1F5Z9A2_9BACT|nr:MAG: hypothetical protein A2154_01735 [Candidatus Gottesmanbacteria bacterium RBG_16_43_7]